MDPSLTSIAAVTAQVAVILAAGVAYLRNVRVDRPPVGVFNHRDVLLVGVVLVVIPPLYLRLPAPVLAAFFAVLSTALLYFALAPLFAARRAGAAAVALVAVDMALVGHGWLFDAVNNLALAVMVVGVCNMWVQSGIRARHVAVLAGALAVYDVVVTFALPLMADLIDRLSSLPLAPMLVWGDGDGLVGVGLGDILLVLVWTLVAEKAFSRRAGLAAAALGVSGVLCLFVAFWLDVVNRPVPAMVVLGPAIVLHYRLLVRRAGRERTVAEYRSAAGASPAEGAVEEPEHDVGVPVLLVDDRAGAEVVLQPAPRLGGPRLVDAPVAPVVDASSAATTRRVLRSDPV